MSHRAGGILVLGFATLFWWAIVSVFLFYVLGGVVQSWDAQRRYVATSGRVVESGLKSSSGGDCGHTSYQAAVVYEYSVNGVTYRADRVYCTPIEEYQPRDAAEVVLSQYPRGSRPTVYYDPDNPQCAALDLDILPHRAFLLFFIFPFVVCGVLLLALLVRHIRAPASALHSPETERMRLGRVGGVLVVWFLAHLLTLFALVFAGAYRPDRAWVVWIGVAAVAAVVSVAAIVAVIGKLLSRSAPPNASE